MKPRPPLQPLRHWAHRHPWAYVFTVIIGLELAFLALALLLDYLKAAPPLFLYCLLHLLSLTETNPPTPHKTAQDPHFADQPPPFHTLLIQAPLPEPFNSLPTLTTIDGRGSGRQGPPPLAPRGPARPHKPDPAQPPLI